MSLPEPVATEKRVSSWGDDPKTRPDTIARLEKALEFLSVHGVVDSACRQARCSKTTFYDFKERYEDFAKDAQDAADRALPELEATGWACARKAISDPRYLSALIFALKAKAGWRESAHLEITASAKSDKRPDEMTNDELLRVVAEGALELDPSKVDDRVIELLADEFRKAELPAAKDDPDRRARPG